MSIDMDSHFTFHNNRRATIIAIAFFVVFSVIPIGLIGAYRWVSDTFTNQVTTQQQTLSDIAALAINVKLDRLVNIASSLASSSQLESDAANGQWTAAAAVARDAENNVAFYDPFIDRIIVYDTNGVQQAAYPELTGGLGTQASVSGWYGALSGGTQASYVSGVTKRISSPQIQVVNIAVPIIANKRAVGFLVLQIPTDNFLDFGGNLSLGTYGFAYIVDASGNLVANPKYLSDTNGAVVNYSFVPQVKKVLAGGNGTDIVLDQGSGEKSIITYQPVPGYGWGVVVQELYSEAFSGVSSALVDIMLLIVLAWMADVVLACILYQYIVLHHHNHEHTQ